MIVIVDYGMGNLFSVSKALKRQNIDCIISNDKNKIDNADKLILPGVGHFKNGMEQLNKLELIDLLNKKVLGDKTPILGICLGMQLLTKHSQEGDVEGLGWINAVTKLFQFNKKKILLKIPHMGWNTLEFEFDKRLLDGLLNTDSFYFAHSYHVDHTADNSTLAETEYGIRFTSVINKENIYGVQFHPEKSHDAGLRILKNFAENC